MAAQTPQRAIRGSHLRQVSTENSRFTKVGPASMDEGSEAETPVSAAKLSKALVQQLFVLSIHDEHSSEDDVILNLSTNHDTRDGDLLQLTPAHDQLTNVKPVNGNVDPTKRLIFLFKPPNQQVLLKHPALQVSLSQRIAAAFGLEKGNQVLVSTANKSACHAAHVEIVFRDQYLARADMWHLVAREMVNKCIYKDQKIEFMGSIRANIKAIFVRGKKVQSALFHHSTKSIFRSESARYVLFIQMSKEMWDFDAEGTGEIMFDKVINGFLPELFHRWSEMKVKHLISIVLFTRMLYEKNADQDPKDAKLDAEERRSETRREHTSQDYYRVVVSDMASGDWADILNMLKREFKVFLKDISIRKPDAGDHLPLGEGLYSALADTPDHVIAGYPSAATHGNVLEAINLASSQFSADYIDRDLVRTGVSIVVISPGAGLFEVDYNLLVATTDNLIENGVGIDLVCLSRMPLHSVPLFKYRQPPRDTLDHLLAARPNVQRDDRTPTGSFISHSGSPTPPLVSNSEETKHQKSATLESSNRDRWSYGIPHWIDISFWIRSSTTGSSQVSTISKAESKSAFDTPQHKTFVPRVKMYELQMMGVMENAIGDISIPHLSKGFGVPTKGTFDAMRTAVSGLSKPDSKLPVLNALISQSPNLHDCTQKLSTSVTSVQSINQKIMQPQFRWMDDYDDLVYRHPLVVRKRARRIRAVENTSKSRQNHRYSPSLLGTSADKRHNLVPKIDHSPDDGSYLTQEKLKHRLPQSKRNTDAKTDDLPSRKQTVRPQASKSGRQLSLGLPKFPAKAVPSTEVTTQHDIGSLLSRGFKSSLLTRSSGLSSVSSTKAQASKGIVHPGPQVLDHERLSSDSESSRSRPIPIRNATTIRTSGEATARPKPHTGDSQATGAGSQLQDRLSGLQDLQEQQETGFEPDLDPVDDVLPPPVALSPSTTLAPWLTILNPSNPSKTETALASRLGRWQHIFPRPLKASQIKWKSLCSPAAIPLTTEDFPSSEQLAEEYERSAYRIDLPNDTDISETSWSPITEILAFRLSRGFQLVVGPRVAESTKTPSMQALDVFDGMNVADKGTSIFLTRGSTIHQVSRIEANKVEVKQYFRYGGETVRDSTLGSILYKPLIRSMLADEYSMQEIPIAPLRSNFDWKMIDSFVLGHERPQAADFVDNLRPWRARFVLIPVEATSSARRRVRSDEDDEEEIRLEGIRKLTQVWQRFRHIPPEERRYQAPVRNRKDTNPLDILYQTRDPSAIVAAESENVAEGDAAGGQLQLLPDSDLFQRSNFKIALLAEIIQSEKGVRMLDRRWHLRLHYNCFIGFELTSWLLQNFRDVDTREEAVELGNELMTSGMFKHVEQRHNFRDGNYFYQIADDYRTPRPESKSWLFGRGKASKASVPSTPMSEDLPKELNTTGRSRSISSNSADDNDPTTPTGQKKQLGVALSRSLIYDVDHRKRSYRPELVFLHYDRLHNPDNCYHIRVEWMNTTSKLIQDAVRSWATTVDRFGLRLVEIPIAEASSISAQHPFRAPYLVKLAKQPPNKQPEGYFDHAAFGPQSRRDAHFYHKAIMKRFNFVLDFEAASDFPADVDVTYSWGKPDYRFPQYIHRSGMLIAQITDEGDFLLLANRLYNNRNANPPSNPEPNRGDHPGENDQNRGPGFFRSSPHRGTHAPHRPSPLHSPYVSPSVRATLNTPHSKTTPATEPHGLAPTSASIFPKHIDPTRPSATASSTPEATKKDFETFCNNPDALSMFYEEVLSKASTPGPNTPFMGSKTPSRTPEMGVDSTIPTLALPGRLVERSPVGNGSKGDTKARAASGGSPRAGSQKSGDVG